MTQPDKPQTMEVRVDQWLQLNRDIGFAEGLLTGWLYVRGDDAITAREATRRFLARQPLPSPPTDKEPS
jgi:hypothetical protein